MSFNIEFMLLGLASAGLGLTSLWAYGCSHGKLPTRAGGAGGSSADIEAIGSGGSAGGPRGNSSCCSWSGRRRLLQALILLVILVIAIRMVAVFTVRRIETGSMWQQDYEWYGLEVAGARRFPGVQPRNRSAECRSDVAPAPHFPELRRSVDPALVPSSASAGDRPRIRVHIVNMENNIFTFLWYSILGEADDDRQEANTTITKRVFPDLGVELELVEPPKLAFNLSSRNLLIVGSHFHQEFLSQVPDDMSVGSITQGSENCRNIPAPQRLKFSFLTYGDCTNVDNRRIFHWPLGSSASYGFPKRIDPSHLVPADKRPLVLNLMVTMSKRKPTRMQALMAAEAACAELGEHRCQLTRTNMLLKLAEFVDTELPWSVTNLQSYFPSDNTYPQKLMASQLTLCPSGNTPEQYRIWEAIAAGSIPVVEDPPFEQGRSLHPAFGNEFGCVASDIHKFLRVRRTSLSRFVSNKYLSLIM